jgi:predicted secreted protein
MPKPTLITGLFTLLMFTGTLLAADEPLPYNRISLDASAQAEVENDQLVAVLTAQAEGRDAATPADEINRQMDWAINVARSVPQVTAQTLGYSSQPIYDKQRIRGWRVSQSLRLQSDDATVMGDLVARLQEQLRVQSLSYQVSSGMRRQHIDSLTQEALQRFQQRAAAIAKALDRSGYRLVRLQVNDGHHRPAPMMRSVMMETASSDGAPAPARIEAGTQTLRVTINGEIELTEK